jgi:hypothetical protein
MEDRLKPDIKKNEMDQCDAVYVWLKTWAKPAEEAHVTGLCCTKPDGNSSSVEAAEYDIKSRQRRCCEYILRISV